MENSFPDCVYLGVDRTGQDGDKSKCVGSTHMDLMGAFCPTAGLSELLIIWIKVVFKPQFVWDCRDVFVWNHL